MELVLVHEAFNNESPATVIAWLQQVLGKKPTFPVVNETSEKIILSYAGGTGLPHSFIIGRDMSIQEDIAGFDEGCGSLEKKLMRVLSMR